MGAGVEGVGVVGVGVVGVGVVGVGVEDTLQVVMVVKRCQCMTVHLAGCAVVTLPLTAHHLPLITHHSPLTSCCRSNTCATLS